MSLSALSSPNSFINLTNFPALEPPPNVVPNFIDPYTRGPMLLVLSALAISIMYLFMAARFYSKFLVKNRSTWDDLTCVIAAVGVTGIFIGLVYLERSGLGTHQWNLRASILIKDTFLKPLYILVNITPLVALFTKLSLYIYYHQIFRPNIVLRWCIIVSAAITTAFYIAVTVALFVLSTPSPGKSLAEQFATFLVEKHSPVLDVTLGFGYFNILSDLLIIVLPISGVMGLNLQKARKIGVIMIFLTGLLALVASVISLYYRYLINNIGDSTWNLMPAAYLNLKSHLSSHLRFLSARLSPRRSSGSRRILSFSKSKNSRATGSTEVETKSHHSDETLVLSSLPRLPKGVHVMRTARDMIWGSKRDPSTTIDDEEAGIYLSTDFRRTSEAAPRVSNEKTEIREIPA
ncbi:hypothetical protein MMC25_001647 [Agyrium rufum]|nr:hypothetical protein [Agyrium rufum]